MTTTTTTPDTITLADGRTVTVLRVDWVGARRAVVHYATPDGYRDTATMTPREVITRSADRVGITVAPGHVITERRTDDGRFAPGRFTVACSCGAATYTGCYGPGHAASVAITHNRDLRHAADDHTACLVNTCAVVHRANRTDPHAGRVIATGRPESDPCEASTPGCAIDHGHDDGPCGTW